MTDTAIQAVPPPRALSTGRVRAAWIVAIVADALQIAIFPAFVEGGASPFDAALDVVVGMVLSWLLGFHWAFLPAAVSEIVPGLDELPTWTGSVFFVRKVWPGPGLSQLALAVARIGVWGRRLLLVGVLFFVAIGAGVCWWLLHRR